MDHQLNIIYNNIGGGFTNIEDDTIIMIVLDVDRLYDRQCNQFTFYHASISNPHGVLKDVLHHLNTPFLNLILD